MKSLYLHIGAHKTGTTALQHYLSQNGAGLAQHGFAYASAPGRQHLHEYLGFVARDAFLPQGYTVLHGQGLAACLAGAPGDNVIASSENFSFFFQPQAIQALADIVKPLFDQVHILCYLRRQDSHAVSHHQEGAKPHRRPEGALWGHALSALPQAHPDQALYLDYNRRLGFWADAFGPQAMILRLYDRALLKDGDMVADFLDQVGLGAADLPAAAERNVSFGAARAKTGHILNSVGVHDQLAGAILNTIRDDGRQKPSRDQAQAFLEPYRAGNRALNARYALSPFPDLFPDDFSSLPEEPQDQWSEDGATSALRAVATQLQAKTNLPDRVSADDLRLAAAALQEAHPQVARRLIEAALVLRPDGLALQKLKARLDRTLARP